MLENQLQDTIVEIDDILYELNMKEKLASIRSCRSTNDEIVIPRSILYKSEEFIIVSILEESFSKSKIKSIKFTNDSQIQIIEKKAFSDSTIEKLTIPSSLINLKKGWCYMTPKLIRIDVHPGNIRYTCIEEKLIIGKSSIEKDEYDVLVFCSRDAKDVRLPSFIKQIESFSFCDCSQLHKIDVSSDSKLQTVENDAFIRTPIEKKLYLQISQYISKPLKRRPETPEFINLKGEVYVFQNYNLKGILFNCIYGKDRHIHERCRSQILVPYVIHFSKNWEGSVNFINSEHSNHPQKVEVCAPYFSETDLAAQIETIYYSNTPRFGRYKIFNLLLKFIKENTPPNKPLTHVADSFFNKIYNKLIEENKEKENVKLYLNLRGEPFELFVNNFIDSESGQFSTIRCFCSSFQRSMVAQSKIIGIDCTFKISPPNYKQVMVIIGKTPKINLPLAYILLPCKKEKIYKMALSQFKSFIQKFHDQVTFLSDFELAEINSIKSELMSNGNYFQLCYFHYAKALKSFFSEDIEDFINDENAKKKQHEEEDSNFDINKKINIKKQINKLLKKTAKIFPFVEHRKVYSTVEFLNNFSQTKKFAKYFSSTYLKRFSIDDWSVYNKIQQSTITNNMVERHNRKLNEMFSHPHPNLKEFRDQITNLENEYYNMYHNKDAIEETTIKHFTDEDFNSVFNELKNYLLNNGKKIEQPLNSQHNQYDDATGFSKIKDLPKPIRKILKKSCQTFFSLPQRSQERLKLLKEVEKQINNPQITYNKIRSWFNNNKDNFENYNQSDESEDLANDDSSL